MKVYSCDFETTVYNGQEYTEVWAAVTNEIGTENCEIFHSIDEWYKDLQNKLKTNRENILAYFHNLKFDGNFIINYLLFRLNYEQAFITENEETGEGHFIENKFMKNDSFKYIISDKGQWYSITIKTCNRYIEIRDSLKLLPFSVNKIGKGFKTKHQKTNIEYKGFRYAGCEITEQEQEYIKNDGLVVSEALEIMFNEGHKKLTIGSCCLSEFKSEYPKEDYENLFPNLYEIEIDENKYGSENAGKYIRKSYHGGWCYVVPEKANKIYKNGCTADVNSLYPSVMVNREYPVGKPTFWRGNYIPDFGINKHIYYFIRIRTRFYLKPNMLPCIQVKGNYLYPPRKWLESSDIDIKSNGEYVDYYYDLKTGEKKKAIVEMTITKTDFELIKEHYDLIDFEILDGCYFRTNPEIFLHYIEKYAEIKKNSTGARRELAKLFLNNLYGKMAMSEISKIKKIYKKENETLGYIVISDKKRKPGYIACGSAITSYARDFTIRTAQKNYHGIDKPGFIYADTDSIHCDISPENLLDVPIHETEFLHWKIESKWDIGYFVRAKTYIERIINNDKKEYNIKVAGLPDRAKTLFDYTLQSYRMLTEQIPIDEEKELINNRNKLKESCNEKELEFITKNILNVSDLKPGLTIPGALKARQIKGGIVLYDEYYTIKKASV